MRDDGGFKRRKVGGKPNSWKYFCLHSRAKATCRNVRAKVAAKGSVNTAVDARDEKSVAEALAASTAESATSAWCVGGQRTVAMAV